MPSIKAGVTVTSTALVALLVAFAYPKIAADQAALKGLPEVWHGFQKAPGLIVDIVFGDELKYCEDVIMDPETGMALLSCDPGRGEWNTVMGTMYDPNPKGSLYIYDYVNKSNLRKITLVAHPVESDFHPLGINIFHTPDQDADPTLYVANHQRNGSTIDIFTLNYDTATATFSTRIEADPAILAPNAIAPISATSFYVTNDHWYIPRLNPIINKFETFLPLRLGWVTLVDFADPAHPRLDTVAADIGFANGILITPTGRQVLVAATTESAVKVYARDPVTNALTYKSSIPVPFRPDNLSFDEGLEVDDPTAFDEEGGFLRGVVVAGHPASLKLFQVSRSPETLTAPSWVVEVRKGKHADAAPWKAGDGGGEYSLRTLYQSNGSHFPTSATGTLDSKHGRLLVSGLYAKGLLEISWNGEA